jgi:hypothetical protein
MLRAPTLGKVLIEAGVITPKALDELLAGHKNEKRRLSELLVEKKIIKANELAQTVAKQLSCPFISLERIEAIPQNVLSLIPKPIAEEFHVVPVHLRVTNGLKTLYVATDDPTDEDALAECAFVAAMKVRAMVAIPAEVTQALARFYGIGEVKKPLKPALPAGKATLPDIPPAIVAAAIAAAAAKVTSAVQGAHGSAAVAASPAASAESEPSKSTAKLPKFQVPKSPESSQEIVEDVELVPSSSDAPALPRRTPKIVTLNAPPAFLEQCKSAASSLGALVVDAALANAAATFEEHRPAAVVVTEDVYAFDRATLNRLALEVDAVLVVWSDDLQGKELAPLLDGAVKRWHKSSYEKGTFVEGRYELLRDLGGKFGGSRWEVRHARTLRRSVLKVGVRADNDLSDAEAVQREQNALSRVHHPAAVDLRDAGKTDLGDPFIVVELVEGRTIEGLTAARERLPSWDVCSVFHQIADCLASSHAAGVTHGDVRPENVVVIRDGYGTERAKLVNWESASASTPGTDIRTKTLADVRGIGECIFHALVGRKRASSEDPAGALAEAGIGPTLSRVVERAVAIDGEGRILSMRELTSALEAAEPRARDRTRLLEASMEERKSEPPPPSSIAASPAPEQRRHLRAPFRTPVRLELPGSAPADGRSEDISAGGLLIMTSKGSVATGTSIIVRFALPIDGRVVSEEATVKWARGTALGIALVSPAAETARQIQRYVELMGEERPAGEEEEEEE